MKHLVTTALAYTNGPLHLGHARSTYIPADIFTRYLRLKRENVFHVGGTDNHGVPITLKAEKEGVTPLDIVDRYHNAIKEDLDSLNVSFDSFGRTHSDIHIETAQEFYKTLKENGYIYEKEIEQFYCEKCSMSLADRYVEGKCPFCEGEARGDHCEVCGRHLEPTELLEPYCIHCNSKPEIKKSIHYFFKLSAMKEELTEYITNAKEMPEHVKNMALRWIEELHDWDVSRNLTWGVPIPKSNGQVMYVWIEAPIGYVSFTKELGEIWKDYWISKDVQSKITHFIGKDITVHHAVFWPGILKGVKNYKMPDSVVSGGYLTLENKKMSTSKNWVVWVKDFVEKFSPDYLRYFLMVNAPLNRDTDFSWDDFQKRINTELIDIIGNFSHRTLVFTERKFGKIPNVQKDTLKEEDLLLIRKCEKTTETFDKLIREYNFKDAIMEIILLSKEGNAYFQAMQPWAITDEERLKEVMYTCCTTLKYIVYLLSPFMPVKTGELLDLMNEELDLEIRGNDLKKPKVIFTKLEEMDILKMKEKLNSEISEIKFEEKVSKNEKTAKKTGAKMELIDIEYFTKVDLRVGKVLEVEDVKKSKKLYKIIVDLGNEQRQIISGLKGDYEVEELIGKNVIVICNLKPAKLCGVESEGMLLAAESDGIVSLLNIDREISLGSKIH